MARKHTETDAGDEDWNINDALKERRDKVNILHPPDTSLFLNWSYKSVYLGVWLNLSLRVKYCQIMYAHAFYR